MKESKAYTILTAIFKREEDVRTAGCKELGTATFGNTLEEARDSLNEAIELHLNTLEDVGERKRFLKERGIERTAKAELSSRLFPPNPAPCLSER